MSEKHYCDVILKMKLRQAGRTHFPVYLLNHQGHAVSGISGAWDLVEQVLVVKALEIVLDHLW